MGWYDELTSVDKTLARMNPAGLAVVHTQEFAIDSGQIGIMVALVFVPELHLRSIKLGTPGKVTIPGLSKSYETEVHLINDRIDMKTRSIDVRLGIPNPDYEIKPGLFIEVELYPEPRPALVLPTNVVRGLGGDRYVFVAENGFARRRSVQIRELESDLVEILSGVDSDEFVIQGPDLNAVQDNAKVTLQVSS